MKQVLNHPVIAGFWTFCLFLVGITLLKLTDPHFLEGIGWDGTFLFAVIAAVTIFIGSFLLNLGAFISQFTLFFAILYFVIGILGADISETIIVNTPLTIIILAGVIGLIFWMFTEKKKLKTI